MFKKIFILSFFVLLISGCTYPTSESPQQKLKKAGEKMSNTNSFTFNIEIEDSISGDLTVNNKNSIAGKVKKNNDKFDLEASINSIEKTNNDESANSQIDLKIIENEDYMKIKDLPTNNEAESNDILDSLSSVWTKYPANNLIKNFSFIYGIFLSDENNFLNDENKKKEILNFSNLAKFLVVVEDSGEEEIDKIKTNHFIAGINKKEILNLFADIPENEKKALGSLLDELSKWPIDLWVGQENDYLYKISFTQNINKNDIEAILNALEGDKTEEENTDFFEINTKFNINLKDFNADFNITKPKEDEIIKLED